MVLQVYLNLQAACTLAADFLINVGLSWQLNDARSGVHSFVSFLPTITTDVHLFAHRTNQLLNFLIMNAFNRGVLTMITALLNVILVRPPLSHLSRWM